MAVKSKKWHWKFLKPVYFLEEKVEESHTIADTEALAFKALQNGYGKLEKSDVRLISSTDIELYSTFLKTAVPSDELQINEDFTEELVAE
jgi:hypothetical protein